MGRDLAGRTSNGRPLMNVFLFLNYWPEPERCLWLPPKYVAPTEQFRERS
jgi:hypothetical protein